MGMVVFNLVDTIYVGRLGTNELAALSFTFPVVMVVASIGLGIGVGASSLISYAIGEGNDYQVRRLTSDSMALALVLVIIFAFAGYFTIVPFFRMLGAGPEVLPLIKKYMEIWYLGVPFVIIPMVGNNALRAKGDMKTPASIMLIIVVVNIVLDPLLIFGLGPFPALGIRGAAIATVIARAFSLVMGLYFVHVRNHMLTFKMPTMNEAIHSWKGLISIGLPAAGAKLIVPVAIGILTRMIASYGPVPVAAYGSASRAEFFVLAVVLALSSVLNPFVGQNIGARKFGRVRQALNNGKRFALFWGFGGFLVLQFTAGFIGPLFSKDQHVIDTIELYLRLVSFGFAFRGIFDISVNVLNVFRKPLHSAGLVFFQMFVLLIPGAYIAGTYAGVLGVFSAVAGTYVLAGIMGNLILSKQLIVLERGLLPT